MEHRRLGKSGLLVSRLGLGTMTWGRDTDEEEAARQLAAFRDAGGSLIDTADRYADGAAEHLLGRLLRGVPRDDVVIATKAGTRSGSGPLHRGTSRRRMLAALDGSLERLGVAEIDLWQVHLWDGDTPLEETLGAVDAAVTSGRVRYAGVSNFNGWQTAAAAGFQVTAGHTRLISTQMEYSLLERGVEREVVGAAAAYDLGLLPWSPLGRGVLTGKYRGGAPPDSRGASPTFSGFVAPYLDERAGRIVHAVTTAAAGLGVTPTAVALAWLRDQPQVAAPIVGARTADQLLESLDTERLTLPVEIRSALDDVSAPVTGYPERTPWG